ncbi:MAG TPA: type 4a pilus biogenesis protein PilO [bacterium]|nr:type 4a pilus biogenesis protein PilO [bacterium]
MRGLTGRERLMVAFMIAAAITTVFWLFIWTPGNARQARLREELNTKRTELTRLRALAATREQKEQEFAALSERIRLLEVRLPSEREIPRLLRQLQDLAREIGTKLTLIRPGVLQAGTGAGATPQPAAPRPAGQPAPAPAAAEPRYRQFRLDLAFDGKYSELIAFLGRLENFPRFLVLTQVSIASAELPNLKVTLGANTFVLPKVGAAPAPP